MIRNYFWAAHFFFMGWVMHSMAQIMLTAEGLSAVHNPIVAMLLLTSVIALYLGWRR